MYYLTIAMLRLIHRKYVSTYGIRGLPRDHHQVFVISDSMNQRSMLLIC